MKTKLCIIAGILLPVSVCLDRTARLDAQQLDKNHFLELHRSLSDEDGTWRTIPWQTSLIKAQNLAAKRGKLLFIWAMDGHPLGCT